MSVKNAERLARDLSEEPTIFQELKPLDADEACSSECWKNSSSVNLSRGEQWASSEKRLLNALMSPISDHPRLSCLLAPALGKPCAETYVKMQMEYLKPQGEEIQTIKKLPKKPEKLQWYDRERKTIKTGLDWGKMTK